MIAELVAAVALSAPAQVPAPPESSLRCAEKPKCARRVRRKMMRRVVAPYEAKLERMHACEAPGLGWNVSTGNGFHGGLQFDIPTWRDVGGAGLPSAASELEQKYRAVLLIRKRGYAPWPVCGFR